MLGPPAPDQAPQGTRLAWQLVCCQSKLVSVLRSQRAQQCAVQVLV